MEPRPRLPTEAVGPQPGPQPQPGPEPEPEPGPEPEPEPELGPELEPKSGGAMAAVEAVAKPPLVLAVDPAEAAVGEPALVAELALAARPRVAPRRVVAVAVRWAHRARAGLALRAPWC